MPPGESKGEVPPAAGCDGIDVLPDEVLQHILGFLEAQESVRTCVLTRRWRHLWKSATGLCVVADEGKFLGSVEKLCDFLDSLLRHRGGSPLHTCKLWFTSFGRAMSACLYEHDYRLTRLVNTWFWHAVRCQVRVLSLKAYDTGRFVHQRTLALDERPTDSRHLMRLDLHSVVVGRRFLNFSNCPSLEHLKLQSCYFESENDSRLHICAPSLVSLSLILDYIWALIPSLESMPSLLKAAVTTEHSSEFCNLGKNCNCEFCHNSYSIGDDTGSNDCVLLKGLSEAKDLALISGPETFIFKRDLRWCPMFSNLKTLLLNDYWCVPDDFRSLACILEHPPVLEKLTLELFSKKHRQQRERKGILRPMEVSALTRRARKLGLSIDLLCCHALMDLPEVVHSYIPLLPMVL
ncbi:hypothetical protein GQ55_3G477500 [Panicum hallii var. hallii]|uniref:F-box domain-containing protein n=1 Tax=Panicum hallii var. hallii TaxID=1504633 RepID=A0A2T7EJH6_9POAL|nr:hypothetical protein GQ55_3G477500 [Panicum hallii var. hallii]